MLCYGYYPVWSKRNLNYLIHKDFGNNSCSCIQLLLQAHRIHFAVQILFRKLEKMMSWPLWNSICFLHIKFSIIVEIHFQKDENKILSQGAWIYYLRWRRQGYLNWRSKMYRCRYWYRLLIKGYMLCVFLPKGTPNTPKHVPEMERTFKKRFLLTSPSRNPSKYPILWLTGRSGRVWVSRIFMRKLAPERKV